MKGATHPFAYTAHAHNQAPNIFPAPAHDRVTVLAAPDHEESVDSTSDRVTVLAAPDHEESVDSTSGPRPRPGTLVSALLAVRLDALGFLEASALSVDALRSTDFCVHASSALVLSALLSHGCI